jgi:histone H3/H4
MDRLNSDRGELIIEQLTIQRYIREFAATIKTDLHWQGTSILALQQATEDYATEVFREADFKRIRSGRGAVKVETEDMQAAVASVSNRST